MSENSAALSSCRLNEREKSKSNEQGLQEVCRVHEIEFVNEFRIWNWDQYKRAITFDIVVVSALIISLRLNIIQHISRPSPKYFALANDHRPPTDKANVSQEKLLNRVSGVVCRIITLDFLYTACNENA